MALNSLHSSLHTRVRSCILKLYLRCIWGYKMGRGLSWQEVRVASCIGLYAHSVFICMAAFMGVLQLGILAGAGLRFVLIFSVAFSVLLPCLHHRSSVVLALQPVIFLFQPCHARF